MASLTPMKQFAFAARRSANIMSPTMMKSRNLSSQGVVAVEKLRTALDDYRKEHYRMCLPSRFKKEIVRAADENNSGKVAVNGLQQVISNIRMEHRITEEEMQTIFDEMGESGKITADRLMKII
eukprot:scaffold743_cov117-Cylindrotheca_fusiformis.AAC.19